MIIVHEIAKILAVETVLDENFHSPVRKWERVDDKDEHSWINNGRYHMENFTDSRWMYYHVDSGIDMVQENFMIKAEMRQEKGRGGFGFGLVFGFDKYPQRINRYVYSARPARLLAASFLREDSRSFERFSCRLPDHTQIKKSAADFHTLTILKLIDKVYFFLDDVPEPYLVTPVSAFMWTGNRVGFYVEPMMLVTARSITIRKVVAEAAHGNNFHELLSAGETEKVSTVKAVKNKIKSKKKSKK